MLNATPVPCCYTMRHNAGTMASAVPQSNRPSEIDDKMDSRRDLLRISGAQGPTDRLSRRRYQQLLGRRYVVAYTGNASVPKIIINSTIKSLFITALGILVISHHNSFRVLFEIINFVYN